MRAKVPSIRVSNESRSVALDVGLALLPWIVLLGFWLWFARRAQRSMLEGGGLGSFLKRGKRFENRQVAFFLIILPLALASFWIVRLVSGRG